MIYRKFEAKDIDSLCEIEEECFTMPWHRESFEETLDNACALFIVAEDDTNVVCGYAGVLAVLGEGEICNVAVRSDYRSQGIGEQIVRKLMESYRNHSEG